MAAHLHVLLIEDDPGDAQQVMGELRSSNASTLIQLKWARSLEEGLEFIAVNDIDAILLDLSLPDHKGLEALDAILLQAPQIPVIVITSQTDAETGIKAMEAGAQDSLVKGQVTGPLLTRLIQYAIQRKQTEMQLADALAFNEQILTASPIGILTYKLTGECVSANARVAQMVGATVEQLKSQNFRELASWKRSGLYEMAEQAIVSRQLVAGDVHVVSTFGKELWLRAQFVTFKSSGEELLLLTFGDITERKHAEAALEANEKRFRSWIEYSLDILTIVDSRGIIQYESPSLKRLLGYLPEDLLGKNAFDFIHAEDREKIINIFVEIIQKPDDAVTTEFRFRHRDGSWKYLEAIGRSYTDEHGELVVLVNSRDITERKTAEAAVEAMQKRFQALIENAPDGIALLRLDGKLNQVTPSTQQILGYTLEEAQGQEPALLTHPDDLPALLGLLQDLIQNPGKVATTQYRFRHKDGSWRWLESTISNLIAEPGVEAIVFNYHDITERKQAEKALEEKEQLLSEAQRIGHVGSWSYEIPADKMTFSDEMYRLLDIPPEDFAHNSNDFLTLIYPPDRPLAAAWLEDAKAGIQTTELDLRILRKNGELRYLRCMGAVNFDHTGKPEHFIGTMQDVTERRVAEMQIKQQVKRLTALSEIDRAIMSSADQRYTLGVILSHVISQLQVDAADVLLLNPETQILEYTAGQGFRTKMIETAQLLPGTGHAGRAAQERRSIRIPDLRETTSDPLFKTFVDMEGFVGYINVPLSIKGSVRGVLEVYQRSLLQPYQEWLDFFNTLAGQTVIAIENADLFGNLQATYEELYRAYDATIEGWSRAMDLRDREAEGHTQRVTSLTLKVAQAMGIDEVRLAHVRRGALLHDIGKLGVPDHILFKPGPLTPEEFEVMQKHPEWAYEMLSPISYLKPALAIPYCHHEKWDGTGYPLGLQGEQIPLEARIFALVDVWDALRTDRPYRQAWPQEKVLAYIREQAGTHFDPKAVDMFIKVIKTQ